jgi:hypothetical protein
LNSSWNRRQQSLTFFSCCCVSSTTNLSTKKSYDPTQLALGFNNYVHWTYKTSFLRVFASLTAFFLTFVTIFAILIYIVGLLQPKCVYVGSYFFRQGGSYFIDAFAISWTTFSTVVSVV